MFLDLKKRAFEANAGCVLINCPWLKREVGLNMYSGDF